MIVFCLLGCLMYGTTSTAETSVTSYIEGMKEGYNLGHSFDTGADETFLGNPPTTSEMIAAIKEKGFQTIRIPVTWDGHVYAEDNTINPSFFQRLDEVIGYAVEQGMYVIINMQNDSFRWISSSANQEQNIEKYRSLWRQIAEHYRDYSDLLSFEAMNEPEFDASDVSSQYMLLKRYQQAFVESVRQTEGANTTRILFIPTLNARIRAENVNQVATFIKEMADPYLAASVQYTGLWGFSVNAAGINKFNNTVETDIEDSFQLLNQYFTEQGIGVAVTSYSLLGYTVQDSAINHGEVLKYYEYIGYMAKQNKIPLILWDGGEIFNRQQLVWRDTSLVDLICGSWNERSSYASQDTIYIIGNKEPEEASLTITYHDATLVGIECEDKSLIEGTDYRKEEDRLYLSKEYLKSIQSDTIGIKKTLTLRFSQGQKWNITVMQTDIPVLGQKDGDLSEYYIPVQYNGDVLTSMEALYEDDSYAGPLDWTSYKEYGYCYTPNYEKEYIQLSELFLNAIKTDVTVRLLFHFQSGIVTEYDIKRTETTVAGMPIPKNTQLPGGGNTQENKELQDQIENENQQYIMNQVENENQNANNSSKLSKTDKLLLFGSAALFVVGAFLFYYRKKHKGEVKKRVLIWKDSITELAAHREDEKKKKK